MKEDNSENSKQQTKSQSKSVSTSTWDWLLPAIVGIAIVKLFGLVGGLISVGSYFLLKPKIGVWGAVAAAIVIGIVVALGLAAIIRS